MACEVSTSPPVSRAHKSPDCSTNDTYCLVALVTVRVKLYRYNVTIELRLLLLYLLTQQGWRLWNKKLQTTGRAMS